MAIQYRVYRNAGDGGPIDYTTPIATTSSLTFNQSPGNGDWRYGVRAYDTVSTLADDNTDCWVRVRIVAGVDVTAIPPSPTGLTATATAAGGCRVEWSYPLMDPSPPPVGFRVWLTAGLTVNYAASPTTTIAYTRGLKNYSAVLTGLSDATTYSVGVRAYTSAGNELNTESVIVVGDATAPANVEGLSLTAVAGTD